MVRTNRDLAIFDSLGNASPNMGYLHKSARNVPEADLIPIRSRSTRKALSYIHPVLH